MVICIAGVQRGFRRLSPGTDADFPGVRHCARVCGVRTGGGPPQRTVPHFQTVPVPNRHGGRGGLPAGPQCCAGLPWLRALRLVVWCMSGRFSVLTQGT